MPGCPTYPDLSCRVQGGNFLAGVRQPSRSKGTAPATAVPGSAEIQEEVVDLNLPLLRTPV